MQGRRLGRPGRKAGELDLVQEFVDLPDRLLDPSLDRLKNSTRGMDGLERLDGEGGFGLACVLGH
jgi:hypothetical protein